MRPNPDEIRISEHGREEIFQKFCLFAIRFWLFPAARSSQARSRASTSFAPWPSILSDRQNDIVEPADFGLYAHRCRRCTIRG
ncbi:MAG: hypothetical protein DMG13_24690 [Acidobacteria bacterium]|nr:MAG: hypothetical protein DMG13_24690 [Acidobacteriota bacterium]